MSSAGFSISEHPLCCAAEISRHGIRMQVPQLQTTARQRSEVSLPDGSIVLRLRSACMGITETDRDFRAGTIQFAKGAKLPASPFIKNLVRRNLPRSASVSLVHNLCCKRPRAHLAMRNGFLPIHPAHRRPRPPPYPVLVCTSSLE